MRLKKLCFEGVTRYANPVEIDFESLGPGLVAIAGPNGAGKTSILEAAYASAALEFPTAGGKGNDIYKAVGNSGKAKISSEWTDGCTLTVEVDSKRAKTKPFMVVNGENLTPTGKVTEYLEKVGARYGSSRLIRAAALLTQDKAGSFLDLKKTDRKDLFAEILDTGGLQEIALAAHVHAEADEKKAGLLAAGIATLENSLAWPPGLPPADQAEGLRSRQDQIRLEVDQISKDLNGLRVIYAGLKAEQGQLTERRSAWQKRQAELQAKTLQADQVRARANAATGKTKMLDGGRKRTADEIAKLQAESTAAPEGPAIAELEAQIEANDSRREDYQKELTRLSEELGRLERVSVERKAWQKELERCNEQAALLGKVPCHGEGPYAGCGLIASAQQGHARAAELEITMAGIPLPEVAIVAGRSSMAGLQASQDELKTASAKIRQTLTAARNEAARRDQIRQTIQNKQTYLGQQDQLLRQADGEAIALQTEANSLLDACHEMEAALSQEAPPEASTLDDQLADLAASGKAKAESQQTLNIEIQAIEKQLVLIQHECERLADVERKLSVSKVELESCQAAVQEYRLLEKAFGRNGIQALEIDAAGPELGDIANTLLHASFGERFDMSFVTQEPMADGSGMKEVFDVSIVDHERDRQGPVDSFSGGEKTVLNEAIALSLAIFVGRRSGRVFETLWRDETAGALDPDNAQRYVRMLRKAIGLGNFFQIIFIAQQPEVYEQADAVLWSEGGTVERRAA